MRTRSTIAPAKVNLCLYVGPTRAPDGRHELVSVMDSLAPPADALRLEPALDDVLEDSVWCPGVDGPNLAAAAIAAFRERTGWDGPPVRLRIDKRIPLAGGMAGGSADAAAALRLVAAEAGIDDDGLLEEIAAGLGADVPSQIRGGLVLATGAGERLEPVTRRASYDALVLPVDAELSAAAVYAEADRLGLARTADDLAERLAEVRAGAGDVLGAGLARNDLQDAARSLCPAIDDALAEAGDTGADHVLVSGSGPTVLALFTGEEHKERTTRATAAARRLEHRTPPVHLAGPESRPSIAEH